jgi:nickel/cobalt transporter (NiCoT) family protein
MRLAARRLPQQGIGPVAVAPTTNASVWMGFSAVEWGRLAAFYVVIIILHVCGWGLFLHYAARYSALVGLGFTAYMLGLRHAFDADHIAAVDDTVRYLLQRGRRAVGIGFFFSLGHSSVVFALTVAAAFAATALRHDLPGLQELGSVLGTAISAAFLWLIGALNLLVLVDIIKIWRGTREVHPGHVHCDELLAKRGLLNRLFGAHLRELINHSWQMYPLGMLFGLGFDTASEIALIAMAAGASVSALPLPAVLSLPILFAAGMVTLDTTDGVLMLQAYSWAFVNPLRKVVYNITITGLSVAVALLIGTIEWLQVLSHALRLRGRLFEFIGSLDYGSLGYVIIAVFLLAWALSAVLWRFGRIEERHRRYVMHQHGHTHDGGKRHAHSHFH